MPNIENATHFWKVNAVATLKQLVGCQWLKRSTQPLGAALSRGLGRLVALVTCNAW